MKFVIRALLLILFFCIELVLPGLPGHAVPDLILLLVIFYSFRDDTMTYVWLAFFGGLLSDVYAGTAFGTYIFAFLIVGVLIRLSISTLFRSETSSILYMASVVTVADLITVAIIYAYGSFAWHWSAGTLPVSPVYINLKVWLDLLLNLILAIPVYWIVEWLESFLDRNFTRLKS